MSRSRILQYGIPFVIFVIGGSFGLREFTEIRYRYKRTSQYNIHDELEKDGFQIKSPKEITLEKEYEKLEKVCMLERWAKIEISFRRLQIDLDNWKNIRIPRPWEEPEDTKN